MSISKSALSFVKTFNATTFKNTLGFDTIHVSKNDKVKITNSTNGCYALLAVSSSIKPLLRTEGFTLESLFISICKDEKDKELFLLHKGVYANEEFDVTIKL